jgi:hypothetical protein
MENIGKLIVSLGVVLVIVGLVLWLFGDKLGWLGNLPGDIKIERPGFTFYFPVATFDDRKSTQFPHKFLNLFP